MADQLAWRTAGGGAEHQGGDLWIGGDQFADHLRPVALAHRDRRAQTRFVEDRTRRAGEQRLGLLFTLFMALLLAGALVLRFL